MEKPVDYPSNRGTELPGFGRSLSRRRSTKRIWLVLGVLVFATLYLSTDFPLFFARHHGHHDGYHDRHRHHHHHHGRVRIPLETLAKCRSLSVKPGLPPGFRERTHSDRYEPGTLPVLIRNATIWTGLDDGTNVVRGDILLENGLITRVGDAGFFSSNGGALVEVDAKGAWVTPGIVDVHSHLGILSSPMLAGASDVNSDKGIAQPWLRSVDALNTHDDGYAHAIAGGVTTSLILPGSDNAIGGQAFTIKVRPTHERSTSSLLVDPPYGLNGSEVSHEVPPRWRHMKHACGENPSKTYSGTRMDTVWSYREAYEHARQIKAKQDEYCSKAFANQWEGLGDFPEELRWEALVDVLRGKVKVHTHCYEAVDMDAFVRLSNEFQFPVAAFHHAHEAYLVPDVLKRAYEHTPTVAMFAAFARYKREAYRHSEFAPRILHEQGVKVVMKSDHPGIRSRWLLHEAQQAHYYGLPANAALASVITNAAELLGLDHRLGYIKQGYDADLVIWNSHPLTLGATPIQVFIDGIPQFQATFTKQNDKKQTTPTTPNFDEEAEAAVRFSGLPPLEPTRIISGGILFRNVSSVWRRDESGVHPEFPKGFADDDEGVVFVENGQIVCAGTAGTCASLMNGETLKVIDLEGGSLAPALVSAASSLGLQEINMEATTSDGPVLDPLQGSIPVVLGEGAIIRAVDGLLFGTRDALLAYRSGVSTAVTSPISDGFLGGLSTHFSLGAKHSLETAAVLEDVTAVHISVQHRSGGPSVSTQLAALRRLLLGPYSGERGAAFQAVVEGDLPLVVQAKNADVIASLLKLKEEVEADSDTPMKMTLVGGGEAHLLAAELAAANVGVIVTPPRPYPSNWEGRRITQGPPVEEQSLVSTLFAHGVTVGIGPQGAFDSPQMSTWAVRNLRWDAAWAYVDSQGLISVEDALEMATTNVEKLLGVVASAYSDVVATRGGELLSFQGKVVAVISPKRRVVDLFE